jgi:hypothetical protein
MIRTFILNLRRKSGIYKWAIAIKIFPFLLGITFILKKHNKYQNLIIVQANLKLH